MSRDLKQNFGCQPPKINGYVWKILVPERS